MKKEDSFAIAFWRLAGLVLACPVHFPLCAVAWFITGLWTYSFLMKAGIQGYSAELRFAERHLGSLSVVVGLVLISGIFLGPVCLAYQIVVGKLFARRPRNDVEIRSDHVAKADDLDH